MKKTGLVMALVLLCVVGILTGCIPGPILYLPVSTPTPPPTLMPISERVQSLVTANHRFAFKLFGQLAQLNVEQNLFVSPSSIAMALAMTYNGAAGKTQQAMVETLELEEMSPEEINQAYAELQANLAQIDPQVELNIANSLWAHEGCVLNDQFVKQNQQAFNAKVSTLDFSDPQAVATINHWVDANTKGKIPEIIKEITPEQVMFLINAVYFKGEWSRQFDKAKTREGVFHLPGGKEKKVLMMAQSEVFPYFWGEGFQAISLPYGIGRMRMHVFLPNEDSNLAAFLANLGSDNWAQWLSRFRPERVVVRLPRFKLEYEKDLSDTLRDLGMTIAFGNEADFPNMCSNGSKLFIGYVKHKAVVDVNEEGTVAAAATAVAMETSLPPEFTVNRPFFFTIDDAHTGAILFMGAVYDPQ